MPERVIDKHRCKNCAWCGWIAGQGKGVCNAPIPLWIKEEGWLEDSSDRSAKTFPVRMYVRPDDGRGCRCWRERKATDGRENE